MHFCMLLAVKQYYNFLLVLQVICILVALRSKSPRLMLASLVLIQRLWFARTQPFTDDVFASFSLVLAYPVAICIYS